MLIASSSAWDAPLTADAGKLTVQFACSLGIGLMGQIWTLETAEATQDAICHDPGAPTVWGILRDTLQAAHVIALRSAVLHVLMIRPSEVTSPIIQRVAIVVLCHKMHWRV